MAKRIIEMAQRGVRDQEQLAADAVRFISANYVENYSAKIESRKELTVAADDAVTGLSAPDGYHSRNSVRTYARSVSIGARFAMRRHAD